jgi:predicted PurR-regulated permease PerM
VTNILSSLNVVFGFTSVIFNGIIAIIISIYLLVETHSFKKYVNHVSELFLSQKTREITCRYGNIIPYFRSIIAAREKDMIKTTYRLEAEENKNQN